MLLKFGIFIISIKVHDYITLITLKGLRLFFKILPISKWWLYCLYFGHHSLSLCTLNLALFWHEVLLLPNCLPGLENPQALHRIKSNAVPSLLTGIGAKKMTPLHIGTSYTQDFRFYSKGNASGTHQSAWVGLLKPQITWAAKGTKSPLNPH